MSKNTFAWSPSLNTVFWDRTCEFAYYWRLWERCRRQVVDGSTEMSTPKSIKNCSCVGRATEDEGISATSTSFPCGHKKSMWHSSCVPRYRIDCDRTTISCCMARERERSRELLREWRFRAERSISVALQIRILNLFQCQSFVPFKFICVRLCWPSSWDITREAIETVAPQIEISKFFLT